jgi:hypothetical protein
MFGLSNNMGTKDRIIRLFLGGAMLACAGNKTTMGPNFLRFAGNAFIAYSLTGWDPLLSVFNKDTKPGSSRNLLNSFNKQNSKCDLSNTDLEYSDLITGAGDSA